jgi:hypothetical protein
MYAGLIYTKVHIDLEMNYSLDCIVYWICTVNNKSSTALDLEFLQQMLSVCIQFMAYYYLIAKCKLWHKGAWNYIKNAGGVQSDNDTSGFNAAYCQTFNHYNATSSVTNKVNSILKI